MEIKRGDNKTIHLTVPLSVAPVGSTVYFMAKARPDDDRSDTLALINISSSNCKLEGDMVRYVFELKPEHTNNIEFRNKSLIELAGEFEIRTSDGKVFSIPEKDKYIKVKVFADIRRGEV